jgi:hypothetical protein
MDPWGMVFNETVLKIDEYFSTQDDRDLNKLYCIMAGNYPTNFPIGRRWEPFPSTDTTSAESVNVNVSFREAIVKGKVWDNMIKWSNL